MCEKSKAMKGAPLKASGKTFVANISGPTEVPDLGLV